VKVDEISEVIYKCVVAFPLKSCNANMTFFLYPSLQII